MFTRQWFEQEYTQITTEKGQTIVPDTSIISNSEEEAAYLLMHKERFFHILRLLDSLSLSQGANILDVGTSHLTMLVAKQGYTVWGIDGQPGWQEKMKKYSIQFCPYNLLTDQRQPFDQTFDCIIYSEVLEHLPVSPETQLQKLSGWLNESGILILTTPNATSYYHRRDMLFGKNPFQMPPSKEDPTGSWHVREYTMQEITSAMHNGFDIKIAEYPWYWNKPERNTVGQKIKGQVMVFFFSLFPMFRDAISIVAVKNPTSKI